MTLGGIRADDNDYIGLEHRIEIVRACGRAESGLQPVANGAEPSQGIKDLAASFQSVVVRSLVGTMERVAQECQPKTLIVAGGVACNAEGAYGRRLARFH